MIFKFKPILIEKIWGGTRLGHMYEKKSNTIGECWGISGHKKYSNIIMNGNYKNITLRKLYEDHRELFGNYQHKEFPIIVKYIDAKENLSIQVHPDNQYALKNENSLGKEECWYILDTKPNTEIIIGHSANSKQEIKDKLKNNIIDIVNKYKIKPNDYFYIPQGTIHAICHGTFLLEVSQANDITYRLYDYDRLDQGKKRELHIKKSLDVINVPDNQVITEHINRYFAFDIIENQKDIEKRANQYGDYISVLEGKGYIGDLEVQAGDFVMVSSLDVYRVKGKIKYHLSRLL